MDTLVTLLVIGVIASNVPLIAMVKRDYIPLNVDESEFEVRLEARQGASLKAMRETLDAVEAELRNTAGRHFEVAIGPFLKST